MELTQEQYMEFLAAAQILAKQRKEASQNPCYEVETGDSERKIKALNELLSEKQKESVNNARLAAKRNKQFQTWYENELGTSSN